MQFDDIALFLRVLIKQNLLINESFANSIPTFIYVW